MKLHDDEHVVNDLRAGLIFKVALLALHYLVVVHNKVDNLSRMSARLQLCRLRAISLHKHAGRYAIIRCT